MTLGPMRAQGTSRTKLAGVLAAMALIGLSAVGLRLSEPEKFQVISGMPGETVKINNGEVSVTQIRVGTFIEEYDQIGDRTPGMFVAVHVTGAATGPKELKLTEARLLSKDVRYESYKIAGGLNISPGFQTSFDTVFEGRPRPKLTISPLRCGPTRWSRAISSACRSSWASPLPMLSNGARRPERPE